MRQWSVTAEAGGAEDAEGGGQPEVGAGRAGGGSQRYREGGIAWA